MSLNTKSFIKITKNMTKKQQEPNQKLIKIIKNMTKKQTVRHRNNTKSR